MSTGVNLDVAVKKKSVLLGMKVWLSTVGMPTQNFTIFNVIKLTVLSMKNFE
jgi:hypothetical protein